MIPKALKRSGKRWRFRRFFVSFFLLPPSLSVSEDLKLSRNVRVKDNLTKRSVIRHLSRIKVSKQQTTRFEDTATRLSASACETQSPTTLMKDRGRGAKEGVKREA